MKNLSIQAGIALALIVGIIFLISGRETATHMTDLYLRTGIALALVIGVIVLFSAFMKKRQESVALMQVMGYQTLGQKKGIAMVKVGQEVLLVAVTATDVKLLKSLDQLPADSRGDLPREQSVSIPTTAPDAKKTETVRFDDELEHQGSPDMAGRVIMADIAADSNLRKLKALKDTLLCH